MLDPEVDSLIPHVPFNRRTFIKATFGTGFAAAVLPVSARPSIPTATGWRRAPSAFTARTARSCPRIARSPRARRIYPSSS